MGERTIQWGTVLTFDIISVFRWVERQERGFFGTKLKIKNICQRKIFGPNWSLAKMGAKKQIFDYFHIVGGQVK